MKIPADETDLDNWDAQMRVIVCGKGIRFPAFDGTARGKKRWGGLLNVEYFAIYWTVDVAEWEAAEKILHADRLTHRPKLSLPCTDFRPIVHVQDLASVDIPQHTPCSRAIFYLRSAPLYCFDLGQPPVRRGSSTGVTYLVRKLVRPFQFTTGPLR